MGGNWLAGRDKTYVIPINWRDRIGKLVGTEIGFAGLGISDRVLGEARLGRESEGAGLLFVFGRFLGHHRGGVWLGRRSHRD